jgi:hypothetical protein
MEDYKSENSIMEHLKRLNINPKILENPTSKLIILGIISNKINSLMAANVGSAEIENVYNNDVYVDFNGNFSFQDFYRGVDTNGAEISRNYCTNIEINENGQTLIDNSERKYDISLDSVGTEQFVHNSRTETKIIQDENFIDIIREDTKVDKDFNKTVKTIKRNGDYVTGVLEESVGNENTNKMNAPETSKIIIMANKNDPKKIGAYIRYETVNDQVHDLIEKQQAELLNAVPGLKLDGIPEVSAEVPAPAPAPAPEEKPAEVEVKEEPKAEAPVVTAEENTKPDPVPPQELIDLSETGTELEDVDVYASPEKEPIIDESPVTEEVAMPGIDLPTSELEANIPASEEKESPIVSAFEDENGNTPVLMTDSTEMDGMSIEDLIAMAQKNQESLEKIAEDENKIKEEVKAKKAQLLEKALKQSEEIKQKSNDLEAMKSDIAKLNSALGN